MAQGVKLNLPDAEILKRYGDGESARSIARNFDCSVPPVLALLRAGGVTVRPRWWRYRQADAEEVVALYRDHNSIRDVAQTVGITYQRVHQILIEQGETLRPRSYRRTEAGP